MGLHNSPKQVVININNQNRSLPPPTPGDMFDDGYYDQNDEMEPNTLNTLPPVPDHAFDLDEDEDDYIDAMYTSFNAGNVTPMGGPEMMGNVTPMGGGGEMGEM